MEGTSKRLVRRIGESYDALGLAFAVCVTFLPIFAGRSILIRDVAHWSLPLRRRFRDAILSGQLLGWDSTQAIGLPLVADPLIGNFYPPNYLYLFPNTGLMLALDPLLHLIWGGLGIIAVLRHFRLHPVARLIGGAAWSLSGISVGMWTAGLILQAMSWLPWAAYAGVTLARSAQLQRISARLRCAALCAIPAGMGYLQGEIFIATMGLGVTLVVGGIALREDVQAEGFTGTRLQAAVKYVSGLAVSVVVALMIGMANLMVVFRLVGGTERKHDLNQALAEVWSFHPLRLLAMIAPGSMGQPFIDEVGAAYINDNNGQFLVVSGYVGAAAITLMWLALSPRSPRRGLAVGFAGLSLFALLIAFGRHLPFHGWFRMLPPFGHMRFPEKYLVVFIVGSALLCGLGAHRAVVDEKRITAMTLLPLFGVVGLLLTMSLFPAPMQSYLRVGLLFALVATLLLIGVLFLGPARSRLALVLLPVIVVSDLVLSAISLFPYVPAELAQRRPPIVDMIRGHRQHTVSSMPTRFFTDDHAIRRTIAIAEPRSFEQLESIYLLTLFANTGAPYGMADVKGYDAAVSSEWNAVSVAKSPNPVRDWLRFSATEFVVGSTGGWASRAGYRDTGFRPLPNLSLYQVNDALPRSFVVGLTEPLRTTDPAEVLVEPVLTGAVAKIDPQDTEALLNTDARGRCTIESYADHALGATCEASGDAMAVFVEQFSPSWEAELDGQPVKIHRVNRVMRGIRIPGGRHRITMHFKVPGQTAGLILAGLGLAIVLAAALTTYTSLAHRDMGRFSS